MAEKLSFRKPYSRTSLTLDDDLMARVAALGAQLDRPRTYIINAAVRRFIGEMEQEVKALAEERRVA